MIVNRLWLINLCSETPKPQFSEANKVYELCNTGALVNYLHNACFSPTKSVLLKAIKRGYVATWSGLTEDAINKNFEMTPETSMGHMNQRRQNICPTIKETKSDIEYEVLTPIITGVNTDLVYAEVIDQGKI